MTDIILLFGLPASGKSTLGKGLAAALDARFISVGDLIRARRKANAEEAEASRRAYDGDAEYDVGWVASLLRDALGSASGSLVIIDGAPPLERAIPATGAKLHCTLIVDTSEPERRRRFGERRGSAIGRIDDTEDLFERRSSFMRSKLEFARRTLSKTGAVFTVNGNAPVRAVLKEALAAITLARPVNWWRARPIEVDLVAGEPSTTEVANFAVLQNEASRIVSAKDHDCGGDNLVLLLKPGVLLTGSLHQFLTRRLAHFGASIAAVARHAPEVVASSGAPAAHLADHYNFARWGAVLIDEEALRQAAVRRWGPGAASHHIISAYDYLATRSLEALDSTWKHLADAEELMHLGPSCWGARSVADDQIIVNGHVPLIVDEYVRNGYPSYALHINCPRPDPDSWRALRQDFLGDSDPRKANLGSLRHLAFQGTIDVGREVNWSNNGFHLSGSPEEAGFEATVWFGESYARPRFSKAFSSDTSWLDIVRNIPVVAGDGAVTWRWNRSQNRSAPGNANVLEATH